MSILLWWQAASKKKTHHVPELKLLTNWCLVLDNEFIVFNWPPQYPDLDTIEQLWDVVEHEIYITDVEPICSNCVILPNMPKQNRNWFADVVRWGYVIEGRYHKQRSSTFVCLYLFPGNCCLLLFLITSAHPDQWQKWVTGGLFNELISQSKTAIIETDKSKNL